MTILIILAFLVAGLWWMTRDTSTADVLRKIAIRLLSAANAIDEARDAYERSLDKYGADLI